MIKYSATSFYNQTLCASANSSISNITAPLKISVGMPMTKVVEILGEPDHHLTSSFSIVQYKLCTGNTLTISYTLNQNNQIVVKKIAITEG